MIAESSTDRHRKRCAALSDRHDKIMAELQHVRYRAKLRFDYIDLADAVVLHSVCIGWHGWIAVIGHPDDASYEWVAKLAGSLTEEPNPSPEYRYSNSGYGGSATCLRDALNALEEWL